MDLLDRLYDRLLRRLAAESLDPREPVTVGQLYQDLIPYRGVRSDLGIVELAPYEHALLRLLAGERGYLTAADPAVAEELQRELSAPNPILGIYRDYAAAEVYLMDTAVEAAPTSDPPREAGDPPRRSPAPAAEEDLAEPLPEPSADPAPAPSAAEPPLPAPIPTIPPPGGHSGPPCSRCEEPLPPVEGVRYCPACGADQREPPCVSCGTPLRPSWSFCIRCGVRQPRPEPAG